MAFVEHKVPLLDTQQRTAAWKRKAFYDSGDVVSLSQHSDVGNSTRIEVGNQAGPIKILEIPGSQFQTLDESKQDPTEIRHFFAQVESDFVVLYVAKPGVDAEEVIRRHENGTSEIVYDAMKVQPVVKLPLGSYATITSGDIQRDALTVQ